MGFLADLTHTAASAFRALAGGPTSADWAPAALLDGDVRPFRAVRPERLAGNRLVLGAYTLWYTLPRFRMFAKIHRTDPALFDPQGPVKVLARPLPPRVADGLVLADQVACAAFTLGIAHRVTGPLHASLLFWNLSYRNSWSMIFHSDNTLVFHTLVAGFSPSADAWSVDAVIRRARTGEGAPQAHWRYGFPVEMLSAVTGIYYWLSGVAKVAGPLGWGWATGDSLRSQVAADALRKEVLGSRTSALGKRLYARKELWTATAAPSLVLELVGPLVLVHPVVARVWAVSAYGMHWGIKALMDITFRYQLTGAAYASFVPWERVGDGVSGLVSAVRGRIPDLPAGRGRERNSMGA
ncbi:hypothetical protein [Brevibacterium litoralis]|uniref:hypothetical protein n=1 Tax=Brevibacterium litoralis TaxID=3138935 RepID=UPI0032EFAF5B